MNSILRVRWIDDSNMWGGDLQHENQDVCDEEYSRRQTELSLASFQAQDREIDDVGLGGEYLA